MFRSPLCFSTSSSSWVRAIRLRDRSGPLIVVNCAMAPQGRSASWPRPSHPAHIRLHVGYRAGNALTLRRLLLRARQLLGVGFRCLLAANDLVGASSICFWVSPAICPTPRSPRSAAHSFTQFPACFTSCCLASASSPAGLVNFVLSVSSRSVHQRANQGHCNYSQQCAGNDLGRFRIHQSFVCLSSLSGRWI